MPRKSKASQGLTQYRVRLNFRPDQWERIREAFPDRDECPTRAIYVILSDWCSWKAEQAFHRQCGLAPLEWHATRPARGALARRLQGR